MATLKGGRSSGSGSTPKLRPKDEQTISERRLNRIAAEFILIREIDAEILNLKYERLFPLIETVLKRFSKICNIRGSMKFYIRRDDEFILTLPKGVRTGPTSLHIPKELIRLLKNQKTVLSLTDGDITACGLSDTVHGCLLFPLCYPQSHLLGVFGFFIQQKRNGFPEETVELTKESFARVCAQLQIAFRTLYDQRLKSLTEELWEIILDEYIDSATGFDYFADRSFAFLPDFYPLQIKERPYVNILAYSAHDDQLYIRGATDSMSRNARVPIDQSVTGLLIRERDRNIVNVNPRDQEPYRHRYLHFSAGKALPIREVAMKLYGRGEAKGILNMEFFHTPKFSKSQEAFLRAAQKSLGLLFVALEARWQTELQSARGQEATTHAYINTFAKSLRHEVLQYTSAITSHINAAQLSDDAFAIKATLADINDNDAKIVGAITQFTEDAAGISQRQNVGLKALFVKMRKFYLAGKREEFAKAPFDIRISIPDHTVVRLSRLLEIFVNALFDNSFLVFVRKREKQPQFEGRINVGIGEREIDTGPFKIKYDIVTVQDNGTGVSKKRLKELQDGRYLSDHGGLGWALSGLDRYMRDLGGFIELDSIEGESFVVRLAFRKR